MHPHPAVSYFLAQAMISELHHQARREGLARAAARSTRPGGPRVPGRLRLRSVRQSRAAAAAS